MTWRLNENSSLYGQMNAWGIPKINPTINTGYDSGFDQMGNIAGGTSVMSPEDEYYAAGAAAFRRQPDFEQQRLDIARAAAQPQSKWATGAQTFNNIAQGLYGLGSMYLGYQAMKQQKKAFEFNKGVMNTNLNNSIMDYNRRLGDTLANRALNNGQGSGWVSEQLAKYSAKRS